jgi:hypothetical protein
MPLIDPPNDEVGDIQRVIVIILSVQYVIRQKMNTPNDATILVPSSDKQSYGKPADTTPRNRYA